MRIGPLMWIASSAMCFSLRCSQLSLNPTQTCSSSEGSGCSWQYLVHSLCVGSRKSKGGGSRRSKSSKAGGSGRSKSSKERGRRRSGRRC
jgi:hypothetical protein